MLVGNLESFPIRVLMLLLFLLLGFAASWYVLLASSFELGASQEPWRDYYEAILEGQGCADELGGLGFMPIFWRLLEASLIGGDFFECARSSTDNPGVSWLLSVTYVTLTGVLLLNMLIAMCADRPHACRHTPAVTHAPLCAGWPRPLTTSRKR